MKYIKQMILKMKNQIHYKKSKKEKITDMNLKMIQNNKKMKIIKITQKK